MPTVIFIVGPTAIGKTPLAIKLAKRLNGEIISCDSMQIYKGMNLLSQAPALAERKEVKHHLVGILDPWKEYSAAQFRERATRLIGDIIKRNKIPIIAGGSGLYVKALIDGLFPSPKADLKFRGRLERYVLRYGSKRLHKRLAKVDPDSAKRIHPNDAKRIIRALEICSSTGKTPAELKSRTKGLKDIYNVKIFGLTASRETIYGNISSRVEMMLEKGLIGEVERLCRRKRLSRTAKAVIGFNEIVGYLKGRYDMDAAGELLKRNTRRFAKRQLTWFRADSRIRWFDVSRLNDKAIVANIIKAVR